MYLHQQQSDLICNNWGSLIFNSDNLTDEDFVRIALSSHSITGLSLSPSYSHVGFRPMWEFLLLMEPHGSGHTHTHKCSPRPSYLCGLACRLDMDVYSMVEIVGLKSLSCAGYRIILDKKTPDDLSISND